MDPVQHRESRAGSTFVGTYRQCPRRWMLRYLENIVPARESPSLVFGQAVHSAKETFYKTKGIEMEAVKVGLGYLDQHRASFETNEDFTAIRTRFIDGWAVWSATFGKKDFTRYRIIAIEQPVELTLASGLIVTMRFDLHVLDLETGAYWVCDTKTTGYGLQPMFKSLEQDDQMTGYIWALYHLHEDRPNSIGGAFGDVLYQKGKVNTAERRYIVRSRTDLQAWELGMTGTLQEISQKAQAFREGYPHQVLFPRHGGWCGHFPCDYTDICRTYHQGDPCPNGFKIEPLTNPEEIGDEA